MPRSSESLTKRAAQARAWRLRMKAEGKYDDIWYKHLLKRKYGLSLTDYKDMLAAQGSACAICRRKQEKRLAVDHCHSTNRVRGLLCSECNLGLGKFQDNVTALQNAIDYLTKYSQ